MWSGRNIVPEISESIRKDDCFAVCLAYRAQFPPNTSTEGRQGRSSFLTLQPDCHLRGATFNSHAVKLRKVKPRDLNMSDSFVLGYIHGPRLCTGCRLQGWALLKCFEQKSVKFKFCEYILGRNDVRASLLYDALQNI